MYPGLLPVHAVTWYPYYMSHTHTPTHTHTHTHTVLCKVYTEDLHCSPLLFPLLLDLNLFRHLPLDLYTFFNQPRTFADNRGPIVPLCYKSSVYLLHIPTHKTTTTRFKFLINFTLELERLNFPICQETLEIALK